jgi:hypothetical protein
MFLLQWRHIWKQGGMQVIYVPLQPPWWLDQINPQDQNIKASDVLGFIVLSTHGYNIYNDAVTIGIEWEQFLEETPRLHLVALANSGQGVI